MKLDELVAVPPGVVTVILPVVAPVGTVAVICVMLLTINVVAVFPLNLALVTPVKFVPRIVTDVPTGPLVGVNEVIVGTPGVAVKFVALVAVPPGVVTAIGPVVAPVGTTAVICVLLLRVNVVAFVPLNWTLVTPLKFVPRIVTGVPTGPEFGVNEVIVGRGRLRRSWTDSSPSPPSPSRRYCRRLLPGARSR